MKNLDYEDFKKDLVKLAIGGGVILIFYTMPYLSNLPFILFKTNISNFSYSFKTIYLILYQLLTLFFIALLFKDKLKKDFVNFKKNKKQYFSKYFKLWFLLLFGMMLSNLIIMLINNGQIANNEESVRSLFDKNPIYVYIAGVFIAPFVEELVFRLGIRQIFKTDKLFIIISGLLFGFAHLVGQIDVLADYLYIIPYSIPGFIFAYLLVKTDNIFTSISMHIFHNGVLMGLQFLLLFFG